MLKAILWTIIVVVVLITGLGIAAARKSASMTAPTFRDDGQFPPCKISTNCVSTEADTQNPAYIEAIKTQITVEQLNAHLESLGGQATKIDDTTLHAEFQTRVFGFTDDVLIKFNEINNTVRIRSSSRVGKSDFGANRKRVEALRQLVNSDAK